MKLDQLLTPPTRINSKWIEDLNVRHKTLKILAKNMGNKISDIAHRIIYFSWYISSGKGNKRKIKWWDYIKLKIFYKAKEIIDKIKRQPTEWENIFANTSYKGLISKLIKYLQNSTPRKQTTQLKNGQRTWIDTSPKRTYKWPTDVWKDARHH